MIALKKKRSVIKGQMTRLVKFCQEKTGEATVEQLKTRLEQAKLRKDEFDKVEFEIFSHTDGEVEESELEEFEEHFYYVVAELERTINIKNSEASGGGQSTMGNGKVAVMKSEFRLPKTDLCKFDGKYKNWPAFHDMFLKIIHNNIELTPSQKLKYLNELLEQEPRNVISSFTLTDANYIEAWNKLKSRFDRPKFIVSSFVQEFLDQPTVKNPDASQLRKLVDNSDSVVRNLKSLGDYGESRDPWLIFLLLRKLDENTQQMWAHESADKSSPTFDDFLKFLNTRVEGLLGFKYNSPSTSEQSSRKQPAVKTLHIAEERCQVCNNGTHQLFGCKKFNDADVEKRRQIVKDNRHCFNCLRLGHGAFKCRAKNNCNKCKKRHHELLHVDDTVAAESVSAHLCESGTNEKTINAALLPTALVNVQDGSGNVQLCRALLDSGSQMSFITSSCAQRLGLERANARVSVSGMGGTPSGISRGLVQCKVFSRFNSANVILMKALIMNKVTSHLPARHINMGKWCQIENLELADPKFNVPGIVDILIGADYFFSVLLPGQIKINDVELVAQNTIFGYIMGGQLQKEHLAEEAVNLHSQVVNVDQCLQKFWEVEEVLVQRTLTDDELKCQQHFDTHWCRNSDGRMVVSLPFKTNFVCLGSSQTMAIQRLCQMEKRFMRDEDFKHQYVQFMREYEALNHMEEIPQSIDDSQNVYYLPHHGVVKQSSSTTKLRVVFDASAKSTSGQSLNDVLLTGPTIQDNLLSIIFRFRRHRVVFTADVEKMYRQVLVNEKDTGFQRIVWRENESDPIKHFQLRTVTYGTSCAPYLATRSLNQVAIEEGGDKTLASNIIKRDFYVDDLMSGADDVESAIDLIHDIREILSRGGFPLRKFSSNVEEVLNAVPEVDREIKSFQFMETSNVKVLGIVWNPGDDHFQFQVNIDDESILTKRGFLSEASRLFDPVGWLAPVIIKTKVLFQKLWLQGVGWDDILPESVASEWQRLKGDLKSIETLKIPRWLETTKNSHLEIHGFSDASEDAYAAAIYIRCRYDDGWRCHLISSKTKVAPINQISIPRLELCGAVLLVKLWKLVQEAMQFTTEAVYFWTDSTIVLNWLSSHPKRWKCFIGNRTSEMLQTTTRSQWHHVKSADNPADLASRGISADELISSKLWWHGPRWLCDDECDWPQEINLNGDEGGATTEERKVKVLAHPTVEENSYITFNRLFDEEHSYSWTVKLVAFAKIFMNNLNKKVLTEVRLSVELLELAETLLIKWSQEVSFHPEIERMKKGEPVNSKSQILSLSPYLDEKGIIRVGGRIRNADVDAAVRNPILLSGKCELAKRIVKEYHLKGLHAGPSLLTCNVRQKYWIIGIRPLARSVVIHCIICFKRKQRTMSQFMGDLPQERVTLVRPFLKVGVDYAGPISLRAAVGRGERRYKAYVSIFVCLSTKAVHIELVHNLTTEAFMAAFRRFVSRRGLCTDVFSDNGTNFSGAHNQLEDLFKFLAANHDQIYNELLNDKIVWHFIPPASPHFGGLWEAAVKSMKYHVQRVVGESVLTFEEMNTLLCQVEAMMNSRPICGVQGDNEVMEILTPSHFLIGHSSTYVPERDVKIVRISPTKRWNMLQQMAQHYWQRWHSEYLTTLQKRYKWQHKCRNVTSGDLVLVHEDNVPPTKWLLGRVVETYPGSDQLVRVARIQTKAGVFVRPIHKLSVLPMVESEDSRRAVCLGE